MDHSFIPSQIDAANCVKCKRNALMHTEMATCETCDNIGSVELFTDMAMCASCIEKEMRASIEHQSEDKQQERLENYKLEEVRRIDAQVQLRTDIFNAETVAITEIKKIIDEDTRIVNKPYALAEALKERFTHFKKIIFDLGEQQVEKQNQQRAIQTYLNNLANQLRAEEREKLRLSDMSYEPKPPKLSVQKAPKKKSFDKVELAKYAGECGLPLATFQMLCVQRNMSPKEMAETFTNVAAKVTSNESNQSN